MDLIQVYGSKVNEYREAVYNYLGFKFDLQMDGRVKLTSMYANNEFEANFMIVPDIENAGVQVKLIGLAASGGASLNALNEKIEFFVGRYGSVPSLMAWCTMCGFENTAKNESL